MGGSPRYFFWVGIFKTHFYRYTSGKCYKLFKSYIRKLPTNPTTKHTLYKTLSKQPAMAFYIKALWWLQSHLIADCKEELLLQAGTF